MIRAAARAAGLLVLSSAVRTASSLAVVYDRFAARGAQAETLRDRLERVGAEVDVAAAPERGDEQDRVGEVVGGLDLGRGGVLVDAVAGDGAVPRVTDRDDAVVGVQRLRVAGQREAVAGEAEGTAGRSGRREWRPERPGRLAWLVPLEGCLVAGRLVVEVGEGVGGLLCVLVGLGARVIGLAGRGRRLGVDAGGVVGLGGGRDRGGELEGQRLVGGLAVLGRLPGVAQPLDL